MSELLHLQNNSYAEEKSWSIDLGWIHYISTEIISICHVFFLLISFIIIKHDMKYFWRGIYSLQQISSVKQECFHLIFPYNCTHIQNQLIMTKWFNFTCSQNEAIYCHFLVLHIYAVTNLLPWPQIYMTELRGKNNLATRKDRLFQY